VIAWKCARWGTDPKGATPYVRSDGGVDVLPDIANGDAITVA